MKRKAVTFVQQSRSIATPQGPIQTQQEVVKVFDLSLTLEDLYSHSSSNGAMKAVVIFETEEPRE